LPRRVPRPPRDEDRAQRPARPYEQHAPRTGLRLREGLVLPARSAQGAPGRIRARLVGRMSDRQRIDLTGCDRLRLVADVTGDAHDPLVLLLPRWQADSPRMARHTDPPRPGRLARRVPWISVVRARANGPPTTPSARSPATRWRWHVVTTDP